MYTPFGGATHSVHRASLVSALSLYKLQSENYLCFDKNFNNNVWETVGQRFSSASFIKSKASLD